MTAPRLAHSTEELLRSMLEFRSHAAVFPERAYKAMVRTTYWVYAPANDAFGPSKFVAYAGMTFDAYEQAVQESAAMPSGFPLDNTFQGTRTRKNIESILRSHYRPNPELATQLKGWANHLLGRQVFGPQHGNDWLFITLDDRPLKQAETAEGIVRNMEPSRVQEAPEAQNAQGGIKRISLDQLFQALEMGGFSVNAHELLTATAALALQNDDRFTETSYGRWIRSDHFLANDFVYEALVSRAETEVHIDRLLQPLSLMGARCVLCPADPRFYISGPTVRLAQPGDIPFDARQHEFLPPRRDIAEPETPEVLETPVPPAPLEAPKAPAERDIVSDDALSHYEKKLQGQLDKLLVTPKAAGPSSVDLLDSGWSSSLCLGNEDEGLLLATSPLNGLPKFIKVLEVRTTDFAAPVLASNLRTKEWLVPVPPSPAPYTWVAEGFEEDPDIAGDLKALELEGLSSVKPTLFGVDARGMGILMRGNTLTPGHGYRVLCPPALADTALPEGELYLLAGGWRVWNLTLLLEVSPEMQATLEMLGFVVNARRPKLQWVGLSACHIQTTPHGDKRYSFTKGQTPLLKIEGLSATHPACVLLVGQTGTVRYPLEPGESHLLALESLPVGPYVLEVLPAALDLVPNRVAFALVEAAPLALAVTSTIQLNDTIYTVDGHETADLDLTVLSADDFDLAVEAPPFWRVTSTWRSLAAHPLQPQMADRDGHIDGLSLEQELRRRATKERHADIVFDFGELGSLSLRHSHLPTLDELDAAICTLYQTRRETIQACAGQANLLEKVWLEPLMRHLGYRLTLQSSLSLDAVATVITVPEAVVLYSLARPLRTGGHLTSVPSAALLLVPPGTDLRAGCDDGLRALAREACQHLKVPRTFLTDGLTWVLCEPHKRFLERPLELESLSPENPDGWLIETFLSRFLAEEQPEGPLNHREASAQVT